MNRKNDNFEIAFLGTNGSCAYNGGNRIKYGTNTLCVAASVGGETLIFDSGSGICGFSKLEGYKRERLRLFFSHYHIDHLNGLLFFPELFDDKINIDMYGRESEGEDFYGIVNGFLLPPLHPVGLKQLKAGLNFHTIAPSDVITLTNGVVVRTYGLSHPGGSMGFRVEYGGKSFCYCTDIELQKHILDDGWIEFVRGTDLLILDSFFDNGKVIFGWGHSSWRECAECAKSVGAKRLALFHYGFMLGDGEIDAMEKKAREIFPDTFASADHMRVLL